MMSAVRRRIRFIFHWKPHYALQAFRPSAYLTGLDTIIGLTQEMRGLQETGQPKNTWNKDAGINSDPTQV